MQRFFHGIRRGFLLAAVVFLILLTGCSFGKSGKEAEGSSEAATPKTPLSTIDVLELEWKGFEEVKKDGAKYHAVSYQDKLFTPPQTWSRVTWDLQAAFSKDTLYLLGHFVETKEEAYEYHLFLSSIDTVTEEHSETELIFSKMENASDRTAEQIERIDELVRTGFASPGGIDVAEGKLILFLTVYDEEWKPLEYDRMTLDGTGRLEDITDLGKVIWQKRGEENVSLEQSQVVGMTQGRTCLMDSFDRVLRTLDQEGEEVFALDYRELGNGVFSYVGKTLDGTPAYAMLLGKKAFFCTPDKVLCEVKIQAEKAYLNEFGELLLWGYQELISWNVESGDAERLCSLQGFQSSECLGIWRNSKEELVMAFDDGEEFSLYRYDAGGEEQLTTIKFLQRYPDGYTASCAEVYNRTHPGKFVEVSTMENAWKNETLLNRLAEEMKAGEGPDVLLLDKRQFMTLQGAGCLAPLDEEFSKETKEQIYQIALEMGTIDGRLYGMPSQINIQTLLISREAWEKKGWNLQEVMELYDKEKAAHADLKRFYALSYPADAEQLLWDLCLNHLEDSPFLDLASKTCRFDSEEFCRLLRFCKENAESPGNNSSLSQEEQVLQVREGQALAFLVVGSVRQYCAARVDLGEDYVVLGFPSEEGKGSLAESYNFVAVSAFSEQREEVRDFLEFLFSEKSQRKYLGNSEYVRKDVLLDYFETYTNRDGTKQSRIRTIAYGGTPIKCKPDGTTFVEEYVELMDQARPASSQIKIQDIIFEEAGAYFAGDKSEKEVAKNIQGRVQIYLME